MAMRTLLGTLLVLVLAGCGEEGGAADEASETTVLTLYSQTAAGGEVDPLAVSIEDDDAVAAYAERFTDDKVGFALRTQVRRLGVPQGQVPAAAVVAIGCTPPERAEVEVTDDGVEVTAEPVKDDVQCVAPVTTIAIVAVDDDLL